MVKQHASHTDKHIIDKPHFQAGIKKIVMLLVLIERVAKKQQQQLLFALSATVR